jgi:hypothetical protein
VRKLTATLQVKIQSLAFSPDEQRLASLGGQDDNSLVRMLSMWCERGFYWPQPVPCRTPEL